jgi:hypothetical protein
MIGWHIKKINSTFLKYGSCETEYVRGEGVTKAYLSGKLNT